MRCCFVFLAGMAAGCNPDTPTTPVVDAPAAPLVALDDLAPGDPDCPGGGVRVLVGVDDGAGGGTAGDGELQPGEVTDESVVCSGVDAIPPEADDGVVPVVPPTTAGAGATMDLRGGEGRLGDGGNGGALEVTSRGTQGGHIGVYGTGALDARWDTPRPTGVDLGLDPLVVEGDVTVLSLSDADEAVLGDLFVLPQINRLWFTTSAGPRAASGLHVLPGAVLRLPAGARGLQFSFTAGVHHEGTLTVQGGAASSDLTLRATVVVVGPDGVIDLSGPDGDAETPGGDGGRLDIATVSLGNVFPDTGTVWLEGEIRTEGGIGRSGGRAGQIVVRSQRAAWLRASIHAEGGDALGDGAAGFGGGVEVRVDDGPLWVDGALSARGGAGGTAGGRGGSVLLAASMLTSTLAVDASGGDAGTPCPTTCGGGSGGQVELGTLGGPILHDGAITSTGGRGTGESGGRGGPGGAGGSLLLDNKRIGSAPTLLPRAASVAIAGEIVLRGGRGAGGGGNAGSVRGAFAPGEDPAATHRLLGYARIDTRGGASETRDGGLGGQIFLGYDRVAEVGGGGVVLHVPVETSGGTGGLDGGPAGSIELRSDMDGHAWHPDRRVEVSSEVIGHGGDGRTGGANSAHLHLISGWDAVLTGVVQLQGGDARDPFARAGGSGRPLQDDWSLVLRSRQGHARFAGTAELDGGAAPLLGGGGGGVLVEGVTATFDGIALARGGASFDDTGGDGGFVFVDALRDDAAVSGTIDVNAGDGPVAPGLRGLVLVDGRDETDALGVPPP